MQANLIEDDDEHPRDDVEERARRVRPRIEGGTEELNITVSHSEVLRGIVDSLRFMPWDTRGRYVSLKLSSSRRPSENNFRLHELVPVLLEELGSYPLQKIDIEGFIFAFPNPSVARLLRSGQQTLRHLGLTDILISEVDENGLELLCHAVRQLANLESLAIRSLRGGNTTATGGPSATSFFLSLLGACKELELSTVSLNFRSLALGSLPVARHARRLFSTQHYRLLQCQHFCRFLEPPHFAGILETCRWKEVRIVGGSVGLDLQQGKSLLPIAAALQQNRCVQKISLGVLTGVWPHFSRLTSFSEEAMQSIEDMLKVNDVLKEIEVVEERGQGNNDNNNNILPIRMSPTASFYLTLNRAGRRRLVGNNGSEEEDPTREEWIDTLIAYKDDASVVYFFLSKNPSLCQTL